ncbi:prolipoprotein diacylglyceryl transferase [Caulobacter sp. D4A]|uniref:prolipoprotein diacylglyceryl transferase n=1 Tax=unclassified Caulobacter TaxID=2648921 RepID=UPI000D73B99E|nr:MULTISPECIES: prolipoprotein diacylglyceryl transferase [unclassified Caulobacter]PXA86214.1 prolipoprotein diacylglyceryl transferase [Caulobacter sp. D4A]PXA89363.1 prolipoprotein diacylglyceryl transferase [Caulobacter sp. D5]
MIFPEFDPVLIHLGPLAIRWYALAYVAGILLGWQYAVRLVKTSRLWGGRTPTATPEQIDDLVLWITLGIILGGRLGYVLFYSPSLIWTKPLEILQVWNGGMSFHGGFLGVCAAVILFARRNRIDLLKLGDLVAPVAPLGLLFGRLANFVNGELWGRVTDVPWGVVFCNARIRALEGGACVAGDLPRHPSQLYEAALEGLVLFVVLRLATHRFAFLQRRGGLVGLFMLCYGLFRASLENVRQPDAFMPNFPLGLTMGMLLSTPMLLIGAWLVWRALKEPVAPPPQETIAEEPAAS